jgi:hypothetical protein
LRIKRCGFTLGNQNKYFQTLQIAFHINLYGYCVFHMTCQGFSTFDALPSKLLAGYNITKLSKHTCLVERSLGVKLPTIWIDGKTQVGSVREEKGRRKIREEKESEEGRCRCVREKVEKLRTAVFFQWFGAQEGQSRLAKAAGAEPSGRIRDEKLRAVVARSTFQGKMYKTHSQTTFGS